MSETESTPRAQTDLENDGKPKRHERFYFEDGSVIFLVENTLYRIHKSFLTRDSVVFSELFALPCPPDQQPEGITDDKPIELKGQNREDFECFLSFYYPSDLIFKPPTPEEILSFLRFADKWQFDSQKRKGIQRLKERSTPYQRIIAGRLFDEARELLVPAFMELCEDPQGRPPPPSDGLRLGADDLLLLWWMKHHKRRLDWRYAPHRDAFESYVVQCVLC